MHTLQTTKQISFDLVILTTARAGEDMAQLVTPLLSLTAVIFFLINLREAIIPLSYTLIETITRLAIITNVIALTADVLWCEAWLWLGQPFL